MSLYNLRNPAVKRLMREAEELKYPTEEYYAQPIEDNLFEWHFTLRGPPNTEFEGGIYHGRITLPPDYPMKPPSIILLTPNGRFEINKKICLSISGHHPESWQPSWSIRTALLAIIGFLPTHGNGALGSLDYTPEERRLLAVKSQDWKCQECGYIKDCLKTPGAKSSEACKNHDVEETIPTKPGENSSSNRTAVPTIVNDICFEVKSDSGAENISSDFIDGHSESIPNDIYEKVVISQENTTNTRQRKFAYSTDISEPVPSNEIEFMQPVEVRPVHNYCSLLVIWVILLLLVILIARRWLYYDYSL